MFMCVNVWFCVPSGRKWLHAKFVNSRTISSAIYYIPKNFERNFVIQKKHLVQKRLQWLKVMSVSLLSMSVSLLSMSVSLLSMFCLSSLSHVSRLLFSLCLSLLISPQWRWQWSLVNSAPCAENTYREGRSAWALALDWLANAEKSCLGVPCCIACVLCENSFNNKDNEHSYSWLSLYTP